MQRSSVDLPLPEAPIRHTTSCSSTDRSRSESTTLSPYVLRSPSTLQHRTVHRTPARSRSIARRPIQSVNRASGMVSATNSAAATTYGVKLNV